MMPTLQCYLTKPELEVLDEARGEMSRGHYVAQVLRGALGMGEAETAGVAARLADLEEAHKECQRWAEGEIARLKELLKELLLEANEKVRRLEKLASEQ